MSADWGLKLYRAQIERTVGIQIFRGEAEVAQYLVRVAHTQGEFVFLPVFKGEIKTVGDFEFPRENRTRVGLGSLFGYDFAVCVADFVYELVRQVDSRNTLVDATDFYIELAVVVYDIGGLRNESRARVEVDLPQCFFFGRTRRRQTGLERAALR